MTKTILDQVRDQILHAVACALALVPVMIYPSWETGLWSGMFCGFIRETAQHNTFKIWTLGGGSYLDVSAWSITGLILGLLF